MGWVVSVTPRPLYHRERRGIYCIGGWVGPRAGLDGCEKSRPPPRRNSIPGPSKWYIASVNFSACFVSYQGHPQRRHRKSVHKGGEYQIERGPFLTNTVEVHLSGLNGTAKHLDMHKIRIIGFFFENKLHWQFCSSAVTIYRMSLRLNLPTTPDLQF